MATVTKELTLNVGPQHPATHGVLRLELELEGETVIRCTPHVGYLHRGTEKLGESKSYVSALPLMDRLDYIASMVNDVGYCVAVERLIGIEVPERAQYIRTMASEMARISSHLLWLGTHALDIGAMTVFLYAFREREWLLDLFEMLCGARLTVTYPRIGGVRLDVDQQFLDSLYRFTEEFPSRIEEYETLIDQNRIWLQRTKGIGVISAEEAINWGLTGPTLRGSGVDYDVRKYAPYDAYGKVEFIVPVGKQGDVYDRYRCRMEELRQSTRIIRQCVEKMEPGSILADNAPDYDMLAKGCKKLTPTKAREHSYVCTSDSPGIVPLGEFYSAIEGAKGELGFYLVSDGSGRPYRMRLRSPSFIHASVLKKLCEGYLLADAVASIGSVDIVLGECDR